MARKCATFAFAFALLVALGLAIAHAGAFRVPGIAPDFSAPCESAPLALKDPGESKAESTPDSALVASSTAAPGFAVPAHRFTPATGTIPSPTPWAFPPLFDRPPPANS